MHLDSEYPFYKKSINWHISKFQRDNNNVFLSYMIIVYSIAVTARLLNVSQL